MDCGEWNETDDGNKKAARHHLRRAQHEGRRKVVVTLLGAVLPGDFKIEPRKTYGHISNGMCLRT